MKSLEQLEQESKNLQQQQAQLTADIARLKEAGQDVPWEPTHWGSTAPYVGLDGSAHNSAAYTSWAKAGRVFRTAAEAAEKASAFFTFYQRLYRLALELNEKHGKPNNMWRTSVFYSETTNAFTTDECMNTGDISHLFNTKKAAKEACNIMNRDKWVMPRL
jgi:hypothetical protein